MGDQIKLEELQIEKLKYYFKGVVNMKVTGNLSSFLKDFPENYDSNLLIGKPVTTSSGIQVGIVVSVNKSEDIFTIDLDETDLVAVYGI